MVCLIKIHHTALRNVFFLSHRNVFSVHLAGTVRRLEMQFLPLGDVRLSLNSFTKGMEKKGKATNMDACCTGGSTKRYKSGERRRAQFYHGADAIAVLAATTRLDALPEIRHSPVSAQINRASVRPDGLF